MRPETAGAARATFTLAAPGWAERGSARRGGCSSRGARLRRLLSVVALALIQVSAHAVTTDPIPLGAEGLSLELSLLAWDGATWEDAAAELAESTIEDVGGGWYVISGLPLAAGVERYALSVATAADPDVALAHYTYGAHPGTRITWRQELELPAQPLTFKVGDSYGSISVTVLRRLPAAACEVATVATFYAWSIDTGAAAFNGAAEISDCALDSTTGTYGATLTYDLADGDTDTAGRYRGEFTLCYSETSCHTLPSDNRLEWRVLEALR